LITADGEYKHCSESENADLFWAARGAGPGTSTILYPPSMPLTNYGRIPRNCDPVFYQDAASSRRIREEHLHLARSLFGRGGVVDFKGMDPLF
jgi:hypothetical protein